MQIIFNLLFVLLLSLSIGCGSDEPANSPEGPNGATAENLGDLGTPSNDSSDSPEADTGVLPNEAETPRATADLSIAVAPVVGLDTPAERVAGGTQPDDNWRQSQAQMDAVLAKAEGSAEPVVETEDVVVVEVDDAGATEEPAVNTYEVAQQSEPVFNEEGHVVLSSDSAMVGEPIGVSSNPNAVVDAEAQDANDGKGTIITEETIFDENGNVVVATGSVGPIVIPNPNEVADDQPQQGSKSDFLEETTWWENVTTWGGALWDDTVSFVSSYF